MSLFIQFVCDQTKCENEVDLCDHGLGCSAFPRCPGAVRIASRTVPVGSLQAEWHTAYDIYEKKMVERSDP